MAEKTRAQLLSEINTLLAENTQGDISSADVRSVLTDIKDSFLSLSDDDSDDITQGSTNLFLTTAERTKINYKEALLYITQTGTSAPTIVTTIKNDFTNFAFTYISVGRYSFNADEDLLTGIFAQFTNGKNLAGTGIQHLMPNNNTIVVRTSDSSIGNLANANDALEGFLYIRKYN